MKSVTLCRRVALAAIALFLLIAMRAVAGVHEYPDYGFSIDIPDSGWVAWPLDSIPMDTTGHYRDRDHKAHVVGAFHDIPIRHAVWLYVGEVKFVDGEFNQDKVDSINAAMEDEEGVVVHSKWDAEMDGRPALGEVITKPVGEQSGIWYQMAASANGYLYIVQTSSRNGDPSMDSVLNQIVDSFHFTGEPKKKTTVLLKYEAGASKRMAAYVVGAVMLAAILGGIVFALYRVIRNDRDRQKEMVEEDGL